MKSILIIAGLTMAMSSAYGAGNPFKPKPKPKPVPAVTPVQIQQSVAGGGLTQEEVMALFEQRMALMAEQAKVVGPEVTEATQEEVLESLTEMGLINKEYVYKDYEKGCYIYENANSGEVVESRCYRAVAKRLRHVAGEDTSDQQPAGDNPSDP